MTTLLPDLPYEAAHAQFRWNLPPTLNMATQLCDDWARRAPERIAIKYLQDGDITAVSYAALQALSFQVQAALVVRGISAGDRVGVLLSQAPLTLAAHIAIWRMGAISVPLFTLFQTQALASRLSDSGAKLVITNGPAVLDLPRLHEADLPAPTPQPTAKTGPETPAVLIYTSGTTGAPKGALHGHRLLIGHLPGVEMSHDRLGQPGDCLWTPADWAWIGGLFDVAMPGLALGVPVVAARMEKFTAEGAARIIAAAQVRNVFFPPTALRLLKAADQKITGLRSVASGGEPLGAEMLDWGVSALGVTINEFYGQTECNMALSSAARWFAPHPGVTGRPVPGFEVAVIDAEGEKTAAEGDIAIRRGAASMMLGYWRNPEASAAKFRGDWMLTGDRGVAEAGFIRFIGRDDDVITSAGYRIGPGEVEDCLLTHPEVATVAVVGKPDPIRTEIVKAYVVPCPGCRPEPRALQDWVKSRLAPHCYPREIALVASLPMTITGKVIRKALKQRAAEEVG